MAQVETDLNVGMFVENIDVSTLPDLPYKAGYVIGGIKGTGAADYLLLDGRVVDAWDRLFSRAEISRYAGYRGINKYIYMGIGYKHWRNG